MRSRFPPPQETGPQKPAKGLAHRNQSFPKDDRKGNALARPWPSRRLRADAGGSSPPAVAMRDRGQGCRRRTRRPRARPRAPTLAPRPRRPRGRPELTGLVGGAVVDIVAAHDIVLAQVAADLHFDDLERRLAWVFKAVPLGGDDVDRLVFTHELLFPTDRHFGRAVHHHPMFGAMMVHLH